MFNYDSHEQSTMIVLGALVVISIVGLLANSLLLKILEKLPEKNTSFLLIQAVGITDLLLCLFTIFLCGSRYALGLEAAYASGVYCPILGSATFFFSSMSGVLIAFLSMERYYIICHHKSLPPALVWGLSASVSLIFAVLLTGNSLIGGFAPDPSYMFCMPKGTEWSKYANYTFNVLLNTPTIILPFCYVSIFIKCYRASVPGRIESITKKAAIQSLLFLSIYFLCYIPKFSTTFIGALHGLNAPPKALYMLIPVGMTTLAIVNPILVLLLHRQIKVQAKMALFNEPPEAIIIP